VPLLILMRHGQSAWNLHNRFTGWVDIPLSDVGIEEARLAGQKISQLPIDRLFVSTLLRAQMTAMIAMNRHQSGKTPRMVHDSGKMQEWAQCFDEEALTQTLPVHPCWQLNERYYGKLQGLNKQATIDAYGQAQVQLWRRSFDVPPPEGESLEMTAKRTIPFFMEKVLPFLKKGENLFVCAHGNSLRSIIMQIESMTPDEILHFELATGEPLVYEYKAGNFIRHSRS
jgi:2,3-bisphosphoglycerate-dependent phosphoglycerate mutase